MGVGPLSFPTSDPADVDQQTRPKSSPPTTDTRVRDLADEDRRACASHPTTQMKKKGSRHPGYCQKGCRQGDREEPKRCPTLLVSNETYRIVFLENTLFNWIITWNLNLCNIKLSITVTKEKLWEFPTNKLKFAIKRWIIGYTFSNIVGNSHLE